MEPEERNSNIEVRQAERHADTCKNVTMEGNIKKSIKK